MSRPDGAKKPALSLRSPTLWAIVALTGAVVAIFAGVIAAWPRFTHVSLGGIPVTADLSPDGLQWQSLRSTKLKTVNMPEGTCPVAPPKILPAAGATGPAVFGVEPVHTSGLPPMMGSNNAYPISFFISGSYEGPILVRIRSLATGTLVGISPATKGTWVQGAMAEPRPGARLVEGNGIHVIDKSGQRNLPAYAELDIPARSAQQPAGTPTVDIWTAYVSPTPGCYSMQIDGLGFSELMAFQVQALNQGPFVRNGGA